MTQALINMPEMGFIETIRYMLMVFVFTILYAIFAGISAYLTVVYWIPFLLGLLFS